LSIKQDIQISNCFFLSFTLTLQLIRSLNPHKRF